MGLVWMVLAGVIVSTITAIAVATRPTTPWSGAVCSRMVIEYDDAVADMSASLPPDVGYGQVAVVMVAAPSRAAGLMGDAFLSLLGPFDDEPASVMPVSPAGR